MKFLYSLCSLNEAASSQYCSSQLMHEHILIQEDMRKLLF